LRDDGHSSGACGQKEAHRPIEAIAKSSVSLTRLRNMSTPSLDETDLKLIALLRRDARTPVAALARALGVTRATVQNRIARLEREGTIVGYTVQLRPDVERHAIRAVMSIAVEGNRAAEVRHALTGHPSVVALHTTNGRWDLIAELRTDSLQAFDQVLNTVRLLDGISTTETSLLLGTYK
jgi:DNA-binding Lrp family transcriptional regulator